MFDEYRLEVFEAGADPKVRVRWHDGSGTVRDRAVERSQIEGLLNNANQLSGSGFDGDRVGDELYRWLDGPTDRWLSTALQRQRPILLQIDSDARLRALPWELLRADGSNLAVDEAAPVSPVRLASSRQLGPWTVANRPLRVLFMASSPIDVEPLLEYEFEESNLLNAAGANLELVVEESGSLEGLASQVAHFGDAYFDVVHLSGHAWISPDGPRFVFEDERGERSDGSAADIARALGSTKPRLVFLSGCSSSGASGDGDVLSMAEALVLAGAPAVLGWSLPVGDVAATVLASELYGQLAIGKTLVDAVTAARRELKQERSPYWHLLQMHSDCSPLTPSVTAPGTKDRERLRVRPSSAFFLDPDGKVRVASEADFVGRRRELQESLRLLRPADPAQGPVAVVIHGLGGYGKSTIAARLLGRMRGTHRDAAVWFGKIDEPALRSLTDKVTLPSHDQIELNGLLNEANLTLKQRMCQVLDGPLRNRACLFVFDDFEANLEQDGSGGYLCEPQAFEVLRAVSAAIIETASPSRIIITSRHDFPVDASINMHRLPLAELRGAELQKKLRKTKNLGPWTNDTSGVKERAIAAAAGIPRLIERIDQVIDAPGLDAEALLAAVQGKAEEYREELLLKGILDAQAPETRAMLGAAAIYEIPVPTEAIQALDPDVDLTEPLARATAVGLIQAAKHPTDGEVRYLVSELIKPLLTETTEYPTEEQQQVIAARAARVLYTLWVETDAV